MATFISRQKARSAVSSKSKMSLYHRNLTTSGFMQLQPMFYREMSPFESVNGRYEIWSRLNPLVYPTFGNVDYHYSKFFVRYKDVFVPWDDFYSNTIHTPSNGNAGFVTETPYMTMDTFFRLLVQIKALQLGTQASHDLIIIQNQNTLYYDVTAYGVKVFKVLQSLGYEFSWDCDNDPKHYSLLPLYCLGKIYIDYYWPAAYQNYAMRNAIAHLFTQDQLVYDGSNDTNIYNGIVAILTQCTSVYYDNDGLYAAWDNPVSPNDGQSTSFIMSDPSYVGNYSSFPNGLVSDSDSNLNPDHTPTYEPALSSRNYFGTNVVIGNITKYGIDILRKFNNFVKRNQLAGSLNIDRFLAKFGMPLGDSHRAIKLDTQIIPVRVGDVESNSDSGVTIGNDTFASVVGDLSGKGVASGSDRLRYTNDSHVGMLIGLFSIVPDAGLYQGIDKCNLHTTLMQYWQPDFDQLGVDSVEQREVYNFPSGIDNAAGFSTPYGFMPRYYEYKIGRNILAGDFRWASRGAESLSAYHMYRNLDGRVGTGQVIHSINFIDSSDADQYNRVFYNAANSEQFIVRFRCQYEDVSFMRQLSESYDWESAGKDVTLDGNGVKLN